MVFILVSGVKPRILPYEAKERIGVDVVIGFQQCALPDLSYAVFCLDRKSTRLNSSHQIISYAVFCLKKKKVLCLNQHEHKTRDSSSLIVFLRMYVHATAYAVWASPRDRAAARGRREL